MMRLSWVAIATILGVLAGCLESPRLGGFDAADPSAKAFAIGEAFRTDDRSLIPKIVEQLDSDDPQVRMMAISALQKMTGETLGYRHYDSPAQRRSAVERWVQAVRSGRFDSMSDNGVPISKVNSDG